MTLFILMLGLAQSADAFIYWPGSAGVMARANLDGSSPDQSFIGGPSDGCGVAVDDSHIYWSTIGGAVPGAGTIGRANLDGSAPDASFITGATNPCGLAVDGAHIYWANNISSGTIGRAGINGGSPDQSFITTASHPCGVAVDHSHVYWGNRDASTIGRADLAGTPGSVNQSFVPTAATGPCGVAVNGTHIYWANFSGGGSTIGRANLAGSPASVNQSFITGASSPCGLALDGSHILWVNSFTHTIGRAKLDGSGVDQTFIPGANAGCWVAVDNLSGRSLSISYRLSAFRGKLASSNAACVRRHVVRIRRAKPGPDPLVGADVTNDRGRYSVREQNANGRFYAQVHRSTASGSGACLPAKSRTIHV